MSESTNAPTDSQSVTCAFRCVGTHGHQPYACRQGNHLCQCGARYVAHEPPISPARAASLLRLHWDTLNATDQDAIFALLDRLSTAPDDESALKRLVRDGDRIMVELAKDRDALRAALLETLPFVNEAERLVEQEHWKKDARRVADNARRLLGVEL